MHELNLVLDGYGLRQRPGRDHQRQPMFEPHVACRARERRSDAELPCTGPDVDHALNAQLLEPLGRASRHREGRPILTGDGAQLRRQ